MYIDDLDEIRRQVALSATALEQTTAALLASGTQKAGPYDHPVIFMQHMLWHEGYHFGVMMAALRNSGAEPSDEWSERHVWELWRGPEN